MTANVRCFLALALGLLCATVSLAQAKPLPRIGLLSWTPCQTTQSPPASGEWSYFLQGLDQLGYKPGQNILLECRSADGRYENFAAAAAELVRIPVDLIVASSQYAANASGLATHTIPIVAVGANLFGNSYSVPESNITGIVDFTIELTGKRLELLKEAEPSIRTVSVLSNPHDIYRTFEGYTRRAAEELGLELKFFQVGTPSEFAAAFASMKAQGVDAVIVSPDLMLASNAATLADLAVKNKLAMVAWDSRMTKDGFLLSYASKPSEIEKRLAFLVDRILAGAAPFRLPVEMPSSFSLAVNLRTAAALGLVLPRRVLMMADEVVE